MRGALALLFLAILTIAIVPGCGGGGDTGGTGGQAVQPNVGAVVVGVTSDLRVGVDIDRLRVQIWLGDKLATDEVLTTQSTSAKLVLPAEFHPPAAPGDTVVKVEVDAFRVGDAQTPLVTRLASTKVIINRTLLLRVQIDSRCAVAPGSNAPSCVAPETCISGVCAGSTIDPRTLPAYTPTWTTQKNDICKPAGGGVPIVDVGEGQSDYLPMNDLDVAQVEAGPQGGHHIWVAIRLKNLLQSGSITRVSGHFDDLNLDVSPFQVIFTFDQDEGGYCKLYGLRFRLDDTHDINDLLGRVLKVTVQVTDKDGDIGIGERIVTLSNTIL